MRKLLSCVLVAASALFIFGGCGAKKEEPAVYEVGKTVGEENGDAIETGEDGEASDGAEVSGGAEEAVSADDAGQAVDVKALASELFTQISYSDELSELDLDTAKMFLNLDGIDIEECSIYESSGATAEEIVVLKCKDSDSAAKAKEVFNDRVNEQTENFTDYVPEEIPKLKDAVIITSKEYAVLSVSGDAGKAKSIIEGAFTK